MPITLQNEWLADLLAGRQNTITEYWIRQIRAEGIVGYTLISDEQLREDLPSTVDSMVEAFATGDIDGPRRHSIGVIRRRLADGMLLTDLQMSLHALQTAVMLIVREAGLGNDKQFEAWQTTSTGYYLVALIAASVYDQIRMEQQKQFAAAYELGIELSRDLDLDTTLQTAVRGISAHLGADSGAILLTGSDGGNDRLAASVNMSPTLSAAMPLIRQSISCGIPVSGDCSGQCRRAELVSDVATEDCLREFRGLLAAHNCQALACAPMVFEDKRIGYLVLFWPEVRAFRGNEEDFLLALTGHAATAVRNAMLYEESQGKHELGVLLEASRLFASSLDTRDLLRKIARMATTGITGDLAIVLTLDRYGEREAEIAYHAGNRRAARAMRRIMQVIEPDDKGDAGFIDLWQDLSRGKTMLFSSADEMPGRLQSLRGTVGSGIVVPIRQKDAIFGAFGLFSIDEHAFTEPDMALAANLADLAAVAIANARSYEHERNIAAMLQRVFLPSNLPKIGGYDTAAYYRPAREEAEIGGDFYDVFVKNDGSMSLVIGDVSGKGLQAAIPTAMAKYMIRAYASEDSSPASVMRRLGRAYAENSPNDLFMTAFYGVLVPKRNMLRYVSAGHNPPLFYSATTEDVAEVNARGICLGVVPEIECEEDILLMQPGDVLLLYTDGATDVKGDSSRLEVEGLAKLLLTSAHDSSERIIRRISNAIWDFSHGRLTDDVALIVLKRLGPKNT